MHHQTLRHLILCATLLSVAACAQPGGPPGGPPGGQPPAVTPDTVDVGEPQKPKITTAQLLGQSDAWLREKMGEPAFKRADMQANLWQYKNGVCVLNVFLYADDNAPGNPPGNAPNNAENTPAHVLHFDARDTQGRNTDRDHCLSVLQD